MYGSIPGMTADLLRADTADRLSAAGAGWEVDSMRRDLRDAEVEARHARRHASLAAARHRSAARLGRFIHGSPA
jgi:hypothetical protein